MKPIVWAFVGGAAGAVLLVALAASGKRTAVAPRTIMPKVGETWRYKVEVEPTPTTAIREQFIRGLGLGGATVESVRERDGALVAVYSQTVAQPLTMTLPASLTFDAPGFDRFTFTILEARRVR